MDLRSAKNGGPTSAPSAATRCECRPEQNGGRPGESQNLYSALGKGKSAQAVLPTQFGSLGANQQPLVLPALARSPPALDDVGRDERQASEDHKALWLAEAVTALKDEPRKRPKEAGESRVALGSVPLARPKQRAPPRHRLLAEWIARKAIHSRGV